MRIIGIIIIIGMVAGAIASIDHNRFLDLPSLLIVVGGALGYVLAKGKSKHFIKNFGITGAAWSSLISYALASHLCLVLFSKTRNSFFRINKSILYFK